MCSLTRVAGSFEGTGAGISVWPLWSNRDFTRFVIRRLPRLLVHLAGTVALNDFTIHYEGCVGIDSATLQIYRAQRDDDMLRRVRKSADDKFCLGHISTILHQACQDGSWVSPTGVFSPHRLPGVSSPSSPPRISGSPLHGRPSTPAGFSVCCVMCLLLEPTIFHCLLRCFVSVTIPYDS